VTSSGRLHPRGCRRAYRSDPPGASCSSVPAFRQDRKSSEGLNKYRLRSIRLALKRRAASAGNGPQGAAPTMAGPLSSANHAPAWPEAARFDFGDAACGTGGGPGRRRREVSLQRHHDPRAEALARGGRRLIVRTASLLPRSAESGSRSSVRPMLAGTRRLLGCAGRARPGGDPSFSSCGDRDPAGDHLGSTGRVWSTRGKAGRPPLPIGRSVSSSPYPGRRWHITGIPVGAQDTFVTPDDTPE